MSQYTATTFSSLLHRMHTVKTVALCYSSGLPLCIQLHAEHPVLLNMLLMDLSVTFVFG